MLPRVYGTTACSSSCGAPLLGRRPPPGLCTGSPVTGCFHCPCVTFAMVPDAVWRGSEQRPWGTAPAAGPMVRLGRPSASDPWGVVCCYLSLSRPSSARMCGVYGPLALVHRCACF